MAACRDGDKSAYASLVREYAQQVFAICLGILGNPHDAEDLAQDALIKGFTKICRLRDTQRFAPWLMGIAHNLCIDFMRRRKRGREALILKIERGHSIPEDYSELRQAIAQLPEQYRVPLMLYYFDDRKTESVAGTLGLSQAAVHARLSRARKELRKLLSQQGGAR